MSASRGDGRHHAARAGVELFACPEYCIDLLTIAGESNVESARAIRRLWTQYVRDDWATLEALFVDVCPA